MSYRLYEQIEHLHWMLHRRRVRGFAGGPTADATRGQGRILAVLKLKDGISTKDLSYLLGVRVSSLNELLFKLEKNGYVVREPSEEDKRVMLVRLTDKGRQEEQPEMRGADVFSCLKEDEQKTLEGLLDRILDALRDDEGEGNSGIYARLEKIRSYMAEMPDDAFKGGFRGRDGFGPERRDDFRGHHRRFAQGCE